MKTYYFTQVVDLRFPVDYVIPQEAGLFEEYDEHPTKISSYVLLMKHGEFKVVSAGIKFTTVEFSQLTILILKNLKKKHILEDDTMNKSELKKNSYLFYLSWSFKSVSQKRIRKF